tara:strand:- start:124 stop:2208 length:2085 start_codon:yes stop_codon:yes gene_type:complete
MTGSRAKRPVSASRLAAFAVAPLLLTAPLGSLQAQTPSADAPAALLPAIQSPVQPVALQPPAALAPPRALKPHAPAATTQPQAGQDPARPAAGTASGSEPGVQVDTLEKINPETAGVIGPDEGGLGFNLWQGADRAYVTALMAELPVRAPSPVMRALMRRLLLTAAQPPVSTKPADADDGDAAKKKPVSLITLRVQQLAAMGDVGGVGDLLAAIPGSITDPALLQVEANARFLANDNARACGLTAHQIQAGGGAYWQKAMIFCQILAGEPGKAEIGISMLNELGAKDPAFYALSDRMLGGTTGALTTVTEADGLLLAMARAAKTPLPADATKSNRPGVLRAIAVNPNVGPDIRLEAAERAEAAGALDTEALRQLYSSVSFEPGDLKRSLSRADEIGGPVARALLYHSALSQTVPTAQAEIIGKALKIAVGEGRYGAAARVFQPLVSKIPPSADLLWFAPDAVRLMLSTDDPIGAEAWFKLLQASALFQDDSRDLLIRMTPLVRLVGTMGLENEPRDLSVWWRSMAGEKDAARRAALLYALLDGLGEDVPLDAWRAMGPVTGRSTADTVHPALWFRLQSVTDKVAAWTAAREARETAVPPQALLDAPPAAPAGEPQREAQLGVSDALPTTAVSEETVLPPHRGEVILMVLAALGDGGTARAEAPVLRQAVISLRAIGLDQEAHDLALEAALAAGL